MLEANPCRNSLYQHSMLDNFGNENEIVVFDQKLKHFIPLDVDGALDR